MKVVTAVAFCVVALSGVVESQQYSVRAIETFGGGFSEAFGINNHLQVVGYALKQDHSAAEAYLWNIQGVNGLSSFSQSQARAINDNDQIVGCASFSGFPDQHAFLWTQADGLQDLGTLGGDFSCANAINANGEVVGQSYTTGNAAIHAFVWSQTQGMQDLGTAGGALASAAFGINDNGQVVGISAGNNAFSKYLTAFLWSRNEGMRLLPHLPRHSQSAALKINNKGEIGGFAPLDLSRGIEHAVLWPHLLDGGIQDLGSVPGSTYSEIGSINLSGVSVGAAVIGQNRHGVIWSATNGMQDMNDLIPANSGWVVYECNFINDEGKIVADGYRIGDEGQFRALVLTPQ